MTNNLPSTHVVLPAELIELTERKLITAEAAAALTKATAAAHAMRVVTSAPDGRPLPRLSTRLSMLPSGGTAVGRARGMLEDMGGLWESCRARFFAYRERFAETLLSRAKLKRKQRDIEACADDLDRDVTQAEADLEAVRIQGAEAALQAEEASLKSDLARLQDHGARYAALLKSSDKDQFTEDDFRAEEVDRWCKTAWMYVANAMVPVDTRSEAARRDLPGWGNAFAEMAVGLPEEARLFMESMGVPGQSVREELKNLADQRHAFSSMRGPNTTDSFAMFFEGWLNRVCAKYREHFEAVIRRDGLHKMRSSMSILDPSAKDTGSSTPAGERLSRGSTMV